MYSVFYLPDWRPGLDLAGEWLREAIEATPTREADGKL
jgi:hypothetical protein